MDTDGDSLTFSIATDPSNGQVALSESGASFVYTPVPDFYGEDSFSYKASDGSLQSPANVVTVVVSGVNDEPIAIGQEVTGAEDEVQTITLSGSDPDGDTLRYVLASEPSSGTIILNDTTVTYTPNPDFKGTDAFSFTVSDGFSTSTAAAISLEGIGINDAPEAHEGAWTENPGRCPRFRRGRSFPSPRARSTPSCRPPPP